MVRGLMGKGVRFLFMQGLRVWAQPHPNVLHLLKLLQDLLISSAVVT